jgi:radical SAM superfamily enzyme YgiQ (UPF0313 family)
MQVAFITIGDECPFCTRPIVNHLNHNDISAISIVFKRRGRYPYEYTNRELELLVKSIEDCEIIAFSCLSGHYRLVVDLKRHMENVLRDRHYVIGGYHPILNPDECFEHFDNVCVSEGEEPMLEFVTRVLKGQDLDSVKGFWIRKKNGVVTKNNRYYNRDISDYSVLPSEEEYVIDDDEIYAVPTQVLYYTVCRGCCSRCTYCCAPVLRKVFGHKGWRQFPLTKAIDELAAYVEAEEGCHYLSFTQEQWLHPKRETEKFFKNYQLYVGLPFCITVYPNLIDDKFVKLLKDSNCESIYCGIEHPTNEGRIKLGRVPPYSNDQVVKICDIIAKSDIRLTVDFIDDNPLEPDPKLYHEKKYELISKLPEDVVVASYRMQYFPGTEITAECLRRRMISEKDVEGYYSWKSAKQGSWSNIQSVREYLATHDRRRPG